MSNDLTSHLTDEDRASILATLADGAGMIPCSRYGRHSDDLETILLVMCDIIVGANGRDGLDGIDGYNGYISQLVNDSDGPEELILAYGSWEQIAETLDYFDHHYIDGDGIDGFTQGWIGAAVFADCYVANDEEMTPADVHPMDWNISGIPTFGPDAFADSDDWDEVLADVYNALDVLGAHGAAMVTRGAMSWRELGENAWFSSHGHGTGFFDCGHGWADKLQELARSIGSSDAHLLFDETTGKLTYVN